MDFWIALGEQWQQQSIAEVFAFAFAFAYVWLASQESIWCWLAGFLSTSLYAIVFFDVTLVFQMLLNIYYMAMAVYGFLTWRKQDEARVLISVLPIYRHLQIIIGGAIIVGLGYAIAVSWLSYNLMLLDIATTVYSLIATYLTVKKRLECWYYWSVINLASIYLYLQSELYLSVVLMFVYIVIAIRGLYLWNRSYQEQSSIEVSNVVQSSPR